MTVDSFSASGYPLVSIGVPAYNAKKYIGETIQSILAQDYPNFELLIQDNCSTDGTWEMVQALAAQHPQITIEQNERNLGMVGNFNRVVNRARGQFVMTMGSDDLLLPNFVRRCIETFTQFPQTDLVTTNYFFYDGENDKTWEKVIKLAPGLHRYFVGGVVLVNNFSINFTLFKREALEKLRVNGNPFLTSFYTFDLEMWYRVAFAGMNTYYLPEPLGKFRVHAASASKKQFMHMFRQIFLVLMMHREGIKRAAPLAYRVKLVRFIMRHLGHLLSGRSRDMRVMRALVGELLR
jgi:glycosyltransferase involved in cell wall biosynthesis